MIRDFDLVRELLLFLEAKPSHKGIAPSTIHLDGYSESQIAKHMNLMADAGFIACEISRSSTNPDRIIEVAAVFDLSWKGHEYLDAIRDPKVWRQTKSAVRKVGGASFDVVIDVAKEICRKALIDIGFAI